MGRDHDVSGKYEGRGKIRDLPTLVLQRREVINPILRFPSVVLTHRRRRSISASTFLDLSCGRLSAPGTLLFVVVSCLLLIVVFLALRPRHLSYDEYSK